MWAYTGKIGSSSSRVNAGTLGRGCGPNYFLSEAVVVERIKNQAELGRPEFVSHLSCVIVGKLLTLAMLQFSHV